MKKVMKFLTPVLIIASYLFVAYFVYNFYCTHYYFAKLCWQVKGLLNLLLSLGGIAIAIYFIIALVKDYSD